MTDGQKIIKYLAIVLAIYIIINIAFGIFFSVSLLLNIFDDNKRASGDIKLIELDNLNSIEYIDIDVDTTNITIKESKTLSLETNSDNIKTNKKGNKLSIEESSPNIFRINGSKELIIYLPTSMFDEVSIDSSAGKIDIESLYTKELSLDFGAGKVEIDNLNVSKEAEISAGTGEVDIYSGNINNLELDLGVGNFNITSNLTGNTSIDSGIGKLTLNLKSSVDNYKIQIDKGIGSAKLNNEEMTNNTVYGNGVNLIDIDGGIGSIEITTSN